MISEQFRKETNWENTSYEGTKLIVAFAACVVLSWKPIVDNYLNLGMEKLMTEKVLIR